MTTILTEICDRRRRDVAARKSAIPLNALEARLAEAPAPRGFAAALRAKLASDRYAVIAEIKRASPSAGLIREPFDPAALARAYAAGGAACLSILTEPVSFQGRDVHLKDARAACPLPVLRKDFMIDPYQIVESRTLGADCVLLILAALEDGAAAEMEDLALSLGMDVLLEVHDAQELERALRLKSPLLGINNRNLHTLSVDLATTEALAAQVGPDRLLVAESGLKVPADLARMEAAGARTFLVGESLMRQADVTAALQTLVA